MAGNGWEWLGMGGNAGGRGGWAGGEGWEGWEGWVLTADSIGSLPLVCGGYGGGGAAKFPSKSLGTIPMSC